MRKVFSYNGNTIEYLIDYPIGFDEKKTYPVMFYFHGYGFVGKNVDFLQERCPLQQERLPKELQFILVKPLCKYVTWVKIMESVYAFIESIIELPYCNKRKVYVSGSSMGGYTCWLLLQTRKDLFTAAVICCGGGQYWAARMGEFNGIPIRVIHGGLDSMIYPRESELMAETINQAGGNCQLVIHEDLGHDVWTRTFTDIETYVWLNGFEKE